jgi:hypothetical protein
MRSPARWIVPRLMAVYTSPRTRAARRAILEWRRRRARRTHQVHYFHQVDDPYSQLAAAPRATPPRCRLVHTSWARRRMRHPSAREKRSRARTFLDIAPATGSSSRAGRPATADTARRACSPPRFPRASRRRRRPWATRSSTTIARLAPRGTRGPPAMRSGRCGRSRRGAERRGHYRRDVWYGGEWYWASIAAIWRRLIALGTRRAGTGSGIARAGPSSRDPSAVARPSRPRVLHVTRACSCIALRGKFDSRRLHRLCCCGCRRW